MQDQTIFVAKVLGVSLLIAIALKAIAPRLLIPATPTASVAIVLMPTLIMGVILCWQLWGSGDGDSANS